jgi:putative hydrolase of the HAD superfamily
MRPRAVICDFGGVLGLVPPGVRRARDGGPAMRSAFLDSLAPNRTLASFLADLRASGIRLALLTNNSYGFDSRWQRRIIDVSALFDEVVDGAIVGVRKPDPAAYLLAVELLDPTLCPTQCVLVDDDPNHCRGGARIGMRAIHFRSTETTVRELASLLGR